MPTRTTIFFVLLLGAQGAGDNPSRFFLVPSSTKPNTEECAPVFYRISSEDFELQQRSKVRVDELCLGTNDLFVVIF